MFKSAWKLLAVFFIDRRGLYMDRKKELKSVESRGHYLTVIDYLHQERPDLHGTH